MRVCIFGTCDVFLFTVTRGSEVGHDLLGIDL